MNLTTFSRTYIRTPIVLRKEVRFSREEIEARGTRPLIVEAGLIDATSYARDIEKGEPLQLAAQVYGVDVAAVRDVAGKDN